MRDVDAMDMPAAEPADVADAQAVRDRSGTGILVDDVPDGRRPDQKTVVVIVDGGIVLVPGSDEFRGVTGKEEILQVDVAEHHLLMTAFETVQAAVRVLFKKLEVGRVVLDFVGMQVAE